MTYVLIAGGPLAAFSENGTQVYDLDATLDFNINRSANVSQHPVESGVFISDHVSLNNTKISVRGVISNNVIGKASPAINSIDILDATVPENRVKYAHDILNNIFRSRQFIDVSSELEYIPNCIITSLNLPRRADLGGVFEFSMELEQIQITEQQFTEVSPFIADHAAFNRRLGTKSPTDPVKEEEGWLDGLLTGLGNIVLLPTVGYFQTTLETKTKLEEVLRRELSK